MREEVSVGAGWECKQDVKGVCVCLREYGNTPDGFSEANGRGVYFVR